MADLARVGDSISHGGSIANGSSTTTNGPDVARVGDSVNCATHGLQTITTGSSTTKVDGIKIARVGDSISCGATITSGSNDTDID